MIGLLLDLTKRIKLVSFGSSTTMSSKQVSTTRYNLRSLEKFRFDSSNKNKAIKRNLSIYQKDTNEYQSENKENMLHSTKRRKLNKSLIPKKKVKNSKLSKNNINIIKHSKQIKDIEDFKPGIHNSPLLPLNNEITLKLKEKVKSNVISQELYDLFTESYALIYSMRSDPNHIGYNAEVDYIGCASLCDTKADLSTQRFHVLVGLLLSSQTKDHITAEAMSLLKSKFNGLTIESISSNKCTINDIDLCIKKCGFHNRKSNYLKKCSVICKEKYNYNIPNTYKDLVSLPGIGPKMAYLCMQVAWNNCIGIGVDVHVNRISNLLKWTKINNKINKTNNKNKKMNPENTRKILETYIPSKLWPSINRLLVGFGQNVCLPRKPKCFECKINHLCPIGKKTVKN